MKSVDPYQLGPIARLFFVSRPGRWAVRPLYPIAWVAAAVIAFTGVGLVVSLPIFVLLWVGANESKSRWRHAETLTAIKGAQDHPPASFRPM